MAADIRTADPADATSVAVLGRITFAETFGPPFQNHADDLRDYLDATFDVAKIERSLAKPENTWWLALRHRLPVGYAKLKCPSPPGHGAPPRQEAAPERHAAQLQKIYVLREFLHAGIGGDLLHPLMRHAAARAPLVWLDVLRENTSAIRFYDRHGFSITGQHTFRIGAQSFLFHRMSRRAA